MLRRLNSFDKAAGVPGRFVFTGLPYHKQTVFFTNGKPRLNPLQDMVRVCFSASLRKDPAPASRDCAIALELKLLGQPSYQKGTSVFHT